MEKYESRQYQINRPASDVYTALSDFSNFTPFFQDKVDDWQATENSCSFRTKGLTLNLDIVDKVPFDYIKIASGAGIPMAFTFWIQLKEVAPNDTRLKLTLHAELNMMMKMMVGGKLRDGIDQVAETIANAFNGNFANMPPMDSMSPLSAGNDIYGDFSSFGGKEKLPS